MCSDAQPVKYGALAIVMSGGYKDNADTGQTFTYTGEGGQKKGKQVRVSRMTYRPCVQSGCLAVRVEHGGGHI
jgi:hypothetical protein